MSDTVGDLQWLVATKPERVVLWLRRWWVWIWLSVCFVSLAGQIVRWALNGFKVAGPWL